MPGVGEVPAHRFAEPRLEALLRPPAELAADLLDVHGVAPVVARAVLDEADQLAVAAAGARPRFIEDRAQRAHDVDVGALGLAANVVGLARAPLLERKAQRVAMVV